MDTGPNWLRFGDGYSNYSGFPNSSLIIDQFVGFNEMFSDHGFSQPERIRQSLSNCGPLPWSLKLLGVTVMAGRRSASPPHRSMSTVRSGILHVLLIPICPSTVLAVQLPSREVEYWSLAMWAICSFPERPIDDFATIATRIFYDCPFGKLRTPPRRLPLYRDGGTRDRCACRV